MKIYSIAFLLLFKFLSCNQALESPQASHPPDSLQTQKTGTAETSIIVFRSADGGQTWQDISNGLPAAVKDDNGASRHVFLQMIMGSIYLLGMGYITINQILKLLFGKKISSLTNIAALPPVTPGYMHPITGVEFYKKQTEQMYGRPYSQIFRRKEYAPFLKLPEAPFSSAATTAFINPLTMEKHGNNCMLEAGGKW